MCFTLRVLIPSHDEKMGGLYQGVHNVHVDGIQYAEYVHGGYAELSRVPGMIGKQRKGTLGTEMTLDIPDFQGGRRNSHNALLHMRLMHPRHSCLFLINKFNCTFPHLFTSRYGLPNTAFGIGMGLAGHGILWKTCATVCCELPVLIYDHYSKKKGIVGC